MNALDESCVLFVIRRKPQVKAVFLDFVCCISKEVWSCNSKEASGESCVFDVLAVCNSTEASAVIRMRPYVKAVFWRLSNLRFLEVWSCNSKEASGES